ncbi:MAG: primosomal protein N' [Planctomycetota bacterium]
MSEVLQEAVSRAEPRPLFAAVALNLPVSKTFDYRVPVALRSRLAEGVRVLVPFGATRKVGTVVRLLDHSELESVKEILGLVESEPLLTPSLLALCRWMADYYVCGLGEVLDGVVPPAVRGGKARSYIIEVILEIPDPDAARLVDELQAVRPKQARVLRILRESSGRLGLNELVARAKVSRSPIDSLQRRGIVRLHEEVVLQDPLAGVPAEAARPIQLTEEQEAALGAIDDAARRESYQGFLLFGVTGSGKTEVYLQAIERVVARGLQGIVLVPEISLTPQTVARFKARFQQRLAVLHSRLTEAQRAEQWRRIRAGEADVVVGARSAVFAPVQRLGLLVVDEEHEPSFKQQQVPRYHARDVALMRGRLEHAPVVLGSATPSLESWRNAAAGKLCLLRLSERVGGGALPRSLTVDLGAFLGEAWKGLVTDQLKAALERTLAREEQAILFLNRRGYAPVAFCGKCREPVRCANCSVALTFHRASRRLICHYCGHEAVPTAACPTCGKGRIRLLGFGTERIEEEVRQLFPQARLARMDSDTMVSRMAHSVVLDKFARGDLDILVGTQMIAKGLDFPRVTLVGILMADAALSFPDFRAAERTFQLVAQVAGRAGRSARGGRVVVQSFNPRHPAILAALEHDYERFAEAESEQRQQIGYPPHGHLVRLLLSGSSKAAVEETAERLRRDLAPLMRRARITLLGPAPAPLERLAGAYRFHAFLKARNRANLRPCLEFLAEHPTAKRSVRLSIDVDPMQTL